jgi:hypothetical protein
VLVEGCLMRYRARTGSLVFSLVLLVLTLVGTDAHRDPCHQRHACPSDHSTYVCGDRRHCDLCPDNEYCQGGKPRPAAQRTPAPSPLPAPQTLTARVMRVIDGDTIEVDLQGAREEVRYIGVDTPETKHPKKPVQPFGPEAGEANRKLVGDKPVRLELDVQPRDHYRRLLAYVYVGETMVNAELVRLGTPKWRRSHRM